jgi:hypothetical protein
MASKTYKGYTICGHTIAQDGRYVGSGSIAQGTKLVVSAGIMARFETG